MYAYLSWVALAFALLMLLELMRMSLLLWRVLSTEPKLDSAKNPETLEYPAISIIMPAKDEELYIEASLKSVLSSDYKNFELIVIDDRSQDRTGEIIERSAKQDHRIKTASITQLPKGWTGKTNAMYIGAESAKGDLLLFTDADVTFDPDTLKSAAAYFVLNNLDMLSLLPGFTHRGFLENVVYPHLALGFSYFNPLTEVNNSASPVAMASGCFILISRKAYEHLGTWRRVKDNVTEDVSLSKIAKENGLRFKLMRGRHFVRTRPFSGLMEVVKFWQRTFYGGLQKSVPKILRLFLNYTSLVILFVLFVVLGRAVGVGAANTIDVVAFAVVSLAVVAVIAPLGILLRDEGVNPLYALAAPLGVFISGWVALSTIMMVINGRGIEWRGSSYK